MGPGASGHKESDTTEATQHTCTPRPGRLDGDLVSGEAGGAICSC